MKPVNDLLDAVKDIVKAFMRRVARALNTLSGGRISPNAITLTSLLMHVVIAWLISQGYFIYAGAGLVVFGLFDALDGELARLQNKAGPAGMLLDSVTDRMKEVLLYVGIAYAFVNFDHAFYAVWAAAALGGSMLVSYVNAWGEVVMFQQMKGHAVNQAFRGSLMRFEVRMFALVVGLLVSELAIVTGIIAVLAWFTAIERLLMVRKTL